MNANFLCCVLPMSWLMSVSISTMPAMAQSCSLLYFDAFGMKNSACSKSEETSNRHLWSGIANYVTDDQSWRVVTTAPTKTHQIDILAGQKTIRAGDQSIMTVALIVDKNGNPAPDGEITHFKAALSGSGENAAHENFKGLSVWRMGEKIQSATGYISAQTGLLQSKRSDFHVVSGEATNVEIQPPITAEILPRSQLSITAIDIKDQFGNHKEDGALVRFQSKASDGAKSFSQAIISNKTATAFPFSEAHHSASNWTAHIGAAISNAVALKTEQQELKPFTNITVAQAPDTGTMSLKAGPFHTLAGHRVIDGTPITFFWYEQLDGKQRSYKTEGYMVDGWAKAIMPMPNTQPTITIEAHLLDMRFAASVVAHTHSGIDITTVEMERQFYAELRGALS